ncbi:GNAT family N-acetyltransferase [Stenotrophomonas sp. SY1]|uniref:GNAT family N-acetyltransferase n=1 Tax=Stenotrophomonas sp. SY1 TaxID=477235 RepID=UPI001E4BC09D|nr:GNAT family N-acetyltransferase [Stenotrophomonas sp. SY1]MCD9085795.1 GNAT family N-acetyltransferase [Stenotrophomonas sp. SY1]
MAGTGPSRKAEPRLARQEELALLPRIEQQAGERLRGHPAWPVFAACPTDVVAFEQGWLRQSLWVIEGGNGEVVGYLLAGVLGSDFHVQQMDVLPAHGGKGYGRTLLRHALMQAAERGHHRAVLTTLSDVPWNADFYASEGFRVVPRAAWSDAMQSVMAEEAAAGFPMTLRVVMLQEF